jgi:hypothetical protein
MSPDATSRTRIHVEVDDAHLSEVMRRYGVATEREAVVLAVGIVASGVLPGARTPGETESGTVEELVTVEALCRVTDMPPPGDGGEPVPSLDAIREVTGG